MMPSANGPRSTRAPTTPLGLRPDPALYKPHADWIGRLILPSERELAEAPGTPGQDWTWIELEQVPAPQARCWASAYGSAGRTTHL